MGDTNAKLSTLSLSISFMGPHGLTNEWRNRGDGGSNTRGAWHYARENSCVFDMCFLCFLIRDQDCIALCVDPSMFSHRLPKNEVVSTWAIMTMLMVMPSS